jgi:hypothetical protein
VPLNLFGAGKQLEATIVNSGTQARKSACGEEFPCCLSYAGRHRLA